MCKEFGSKNSLWDKDHRGHAILGCHAALTRV
nr:MAG TPA: hypothetical protein [Caudoviricetes sp.]